MKQKSYTVTVEVADQDADLLEGNQVPKAITIRFRGTAVRVVSAEPVVEQGWTPRMTRAGLIGLFLSVLLESAAILLWPHMPPSVAMVFGGAGVFIVFLSLSMAGAFGR